MYECISDLQLNEPISIGNEIQVWTKILEEKSDRIARMREEIGNIFMSILKE